MEITDEQFREARRQIVDRLRGSARYSRESAHCQVDALCDNPQNPFDADKLADTLCEGRLHARIAGQIELMEREGFNYGDDT